MADEHVEETSAESEQSNGHSNGHNIGRMAAIAAASGATAYAARKALQSRSSGDTDDDDRPRAKKNTSSDSGASLVTAAVSSGWDVAKDSLMPVIEDAAAKAGTYVAERSPELVRDVLVPRFIAGFEKASRGGSNGAKPSESSDD